MSNAPDGLVNALADRYRIERELGQGGMATVYLAEDLRHHRQVAVKVLRPDLAAVLGAERFLREIEISAKLQHPHILTLIDSGEADGFLYYVMPFVDGESLRERIDREGELPVDEAARILHEVTDALSCAHVVGVVHRDIKPDNVLLSGRHAVVTDFGIAKAVSEATGAHDLTTAGVALGTPAYMAPEQATADPNVDHRADLYAVGVMGYEMLTGRAPFAGNTAQAILAAHVTQAPEQLTARRAAAPPELASAIMRCLEKKPADRWQRAEDLLAELEKTMTPGSGTTAASAVKPRGGVGIAVGVALALVAAVFFLMRGSGGSVVATAESMAVVPFAPSVEDTSLSRLGRNMVVLLGINLDGVGEINMVDASTMLARATEQRYSLAEAAALASDEGASSVVHGSMLRVGDDVLFDIGVYETDGLAELGRATVQAPLDDEIALADSVTWALLRSVWREGEAPSPSVASFTTRSVPALKAYLDGERALVNGNWKESGDLFMDAIALDSGFAWAYLNALRSYGWAATGIPNGVVDGLRRTLDALPPRERMVADVRLAATLAERLELGRELVNRYPDYWPGILEQMDPLLHYGGYLGRSVEEIGAVARRLADVAPHLLPAWEHLAYAGFMADRPEWIREALDTLRNRGVDSLPFYWSGNTWAEPMNLMEASIPVARGETPDVDRSIWTTERAASFLRAAFPGTPPGFTTFYAVGPRNTRALAEVLLTAAPASATADDLRRSATWSWLTQGAWDSAYVALDNYVARTSDVRAPLFAYRMAVMGSWVGEGAPERVTRTRAAAFSARSGLAEEDEIELLWVEGLRAYVDGDRVGLESSISALDRVQTGSNSDLNREAAGYLFRSLNAFATDLDGDRDTAASMLAGAEWDRHGVSPSRHATAHPFLTAINRLAAGQWLQDSGNHGEAERLLRWGETLPANDQLRSADLAFMSLGTIQQARVAETLGKNDDARRYYAKFLNYFDMPSPSLAPLRDEAQQALARLTAEAR